MRASIGELSVLARRGVALRAVLAALVISPLAVTAAAPHAARATLRVAQLLPAPGSTEVPLDGLVAVVFDRPVVPLARLGDGGHAATISPPLAGQQRWLGTAIWAIVPAHGLAPATTYTLHLNPALRALDGSAPATTASWQFTTPRPAVASFTPGNNASGLLPRVPVDVDFNMAVDRASAQAHFALTLAGTPIAGAFSWRNARIMRFTPAAALPRGSLPLITESAGFTAPGGPLPADRSFQSSFGVAPPFALTSSDPADGAAAVNPYGTVSLHFSAPINPRAARRYLSVRPALPALHVDVSDQNTLTINGNFRPSTAYRVTIAAGLPSMLGDRLPSARTISFRTDQYQASLQVYGSFNTYSAYRGARLYASALNVPRVTITLYRQSEAEFLRTNAPGFSQSGYVPAGPLVATYRVAVHAPLNKTAGIVQALTLPGGTPLPPGYYVALASAPGVPNVQYLPLLVTRTALTLKTGDNGVLVWATDLRSGAALAGLPVRVLDANGRPLLRGRTDAGGVFTGTVARGRHLAYQNLRALLDRPGDVAAVASEWNDGISAYDFNLPFDPTLNHIRLYLNTDRPIYRPGQTVYLRGVARGDDDGRYRLLPAGSSARLTATDALGHTFFDRYLPINTQGIFDGQLTLPDGAALGGYSLQATISNESTGASFTVAAYKKPTFKVLVLADRGENGNYVQGQRIGVTAHAAYYFGAPLAHAPVQWSVSSAATPFYAPGYDDYSFEDSDVLTQLYQSAANQQVATFSGQTGAMGETALTLRADAQGSPLPRLLTVEANVTSPTQQQVAQQSSIMVNPSGVYVGLRPRSYVAAPNTPQGVDVVTLRPDGTPAPRVTVALTLQRRLIYSVEQFDPQAGYMWQNRNRDVTLRTFSVTTDAGGHALARLTLPAEGEFRLAGTARDGVGNPARSAAYLYSMAPDSGSYVDWGIANNDRINLIADRMRYAVGQTAHILVPAPFAGMRALVTVERGTILSHWVVATHGNSPVIAIPITRESRPDIYVGVVLFKGSGRDPAALPAWKMGYVKLVVDPRASALDVRVTPLVSHARPGQRVGVAIHTADGYGRPVSADVGLSLVDAALLALAANGNGTLGDAFYAQRPLGVSTAASMAVFIDRLNITPGNGSKGGGSGGGGGVAGIRARFPDTAYWNPNVVTDAKGNAVVTLTLPDNLTTWRVSADGSTAGTLMGRGGADLVASKPLLIEPALPRFLALHDRGELGAVVSNLTDAAVSLRVSGSARGADGAATPLPGRTLTVPAHADRAVYWSYSPRAEGPLTVTLSAQGPTPALSDALRVTLPVEQNSLIAAEAAATAGDVTGATARERVTLPGAIEQGEGDLRLTLEPTLVAGLGGAVNYLFAFPYDGVEQVTSRLTGLLSVASLPGYATGEFGCAALLNTVTSLTALLYALQGSDGGWGWWPEDPSAPYLSAYAYEGLILAKERGYAVDGGVLNNAASYLKGRLTALASDPYAPNDSARAFVLYALSRAGSPDAGAAAALYERRAKLGAAARAELALALSAAGGADDPRVRDLIAALSGAARLTSVDAHWDAGANPDAETMQSSVSDTAEALRALIALAPRSPLIPRAVRWLMDQRGVGVPGRGPGPDGAWQSTQATALALQAAALYALHAGDARPAYAYRVLIDGRVVQQGTVTPATAGQPRVLTVPTDLLRRYGGAATIAIERHALPGGPPIAATPLHYTLRLRYYPVPGSVGAVDSGIGITRRYLTHAGAVAADSAPAGSTLTVELRLLVPQDLSRVLIEDPLPAGAEAVDGTLLTSSAFAQPGDAPGRSNGAYASAQAGNTNGAYAMPQAGQPRDLSLLVDHTELRDDRVALFATSIPAGSYLYRYTIHLTNAGLYHVLPAHAVQLYEPEVFGHTALESFTVRS